MAEHTPGPWGYDETTLAICRLIVTIEEVQAFRVSPTASSNHVITYVPCDVNRQEQEANARLIAAAPDLLAALEGFVQRVEGLKSRLRRPLWLDASLTEAKAAIAKAKGGGA